VIDTIKDKIHKRGEEVCPVRIFCVQGGKSSNADVCTFDAKNCGLLKFMVCPCGQGVGVDPVRAFCGQSRGVNFSRFCVDVP